ncbi:hypothetical protein KAU25_06255 [Candidatus Bathyarchaeota archaeon]|nr:hypothetical protein [Candidatus Bathyarchaeota archaeon]
MSVRARISYPMYDGCRLEHDPLYTVYFAEAVTPLETSNVGGFIVLAVIVCVVVLAVVALVLRRKGS